MLATMLLLAPAGMASAQDSPLQFLENLMRPPVNAVTSAFRPVSPAPAPKPKPKKAAANATSCRCRCRD